MFKRHAIWQKTLLGAVLAAGLAMPGFAGDDISADTVVAIVNGEPITLGEMIATAETLPDQYRNLPDDVLFEGILNQLIQQTALSQALEAPEPRRIPLSLKNERRLLRAGAQIERIAKDAVTDEAIRQAYEERYAKAEPSKEYNASHILVETKEEAEEIIQELEKGADFAGLAREKSTGPSGPNGGQLGWFGPGMMVKPFEDAVIALEPGQISEPVETQFGWHVIRLNETRLKDAPKLEDVREELRQEIERAAVEKAIKEIADKADVEKPGEGKIPPAALRDSSLID